MTFIEYFNSLCAPAVVYIVLVFVGIISQLMSKSATFFGTIATIIIAGLWSWLLNYICKSGYVGVSWFLVFLPILLFVLIFVFLIKYMTQITNSMTPEEKKKALEELKKK